MTHNRMLLWTLGLLCLALPGHGGEPPLYPIEAQLAAATNAARAQHGLPALVVDEQLEDSARTHASWMSAHGAMIHSRGPYAENIAMGYAETDAVLRGWLDSPGHRANILAASHTRIGVAAYVLPGQRIYWCQQFR
jgi:uncharacterized protein YkwD